MKKTISLLFAITTSLISLAQVPDSFFNKADAFFKQNVSKGKVNYSAVKNNPESLNQLISIIASSSPSLGKTNNYKSFYINAYNLLVINGIVKNYPVASPLKINGFFDLKHKVANEKISLNDIENKLLRARFPKEARFHFALVCAGLGCPPIITEAYTPNKLESQLQRQTVIAINNPSFIKVKESKVKISKIFEWYASDFKQYGSYIDFLNLYRKSPLSKNSKVSFYEYDWALNDLK